MNPSSRRAIVATARWIIVIVRCGNCLHTSELGKPVTGFFFPGGIRIRASSQLKHERSISFFLVVVQFHINQIAASIVAETTRTKNPAAVELGRLGGKKGGAARAKALSPKRRSEIASEAARKRWSSAGE